MTQYLSDEPFSVHPGSSKAYRDNWEAVFGRKDEPEPEPEPAKDERAE